MYTNHHLFHSNTSTSTSTSDVVDVNGSGSSASNAKTYEGTMKDGLRHGAGKLTYNNETYYKGNFRLGQRSGHGKLKNKDGKVIIEGLFKDDDILLPPPRLKLK